MLPVLIINSLHTDPILINDFSRLAPLISNKLNGTPTRGHNLKIINLVMADRKNGGTSSNHSNHHSNPRTIIPSRVSNDWRQSTKRHEESIYPTAGHLVQFTGFTTTWRPLQPHTCNLVYQNFSRAVLQPNLHPCFHRPGQERQRRVHSAASTALNGLRFWEKVSRSGPKPGFVFSVMSYNVLAQDLLDQHPYLYQFHMKESLQWDMRWNNLLSEISYLNPDILCLQEVQKSHLDQYFSSFESLGYQGLYKQRTGVRTDGCAIYYKPDLVTLIEHTTVEYNQPNIRILDRDNVAIIAKFAPKNYPSKQFVVATTHLLYNPKRQDVRLAQTQLLLAEVDRIAFNGSSRYLPVILTGDLNSTPDSALYKFITRGKLRSEDLASIASRNAGSVLPTSLRITDQCQHADLLSKRKNGDSLPREEEVKLIELRHSEWQCEEKRRSRESIDMGLFNSGTLSHNFCLESVYWHRFKGDVEGTTFQDEWISVDYIFFSKNRSNKNELVVLERYRLPTRNELNGLRIPNTSLGSDHLSLVAKFMLEV